MSTVETKYTPEDLLTMPEGDRFELVDGQLVERDLGAKSSLVGGNLYRLMSTHNHANHLGWVWPADASYQCYRDQPNKVRRPDVSFISLARMPVDRIPDGHIPIYPDLAVEVLSPNDLDYETDEKVEEYLAAGVQLVWVVNPETRTVLIYRANGSIQGLREQDEISGEAVFLGFRCRLAEIFLPETGNS